MIHPIISETFSAVSTPIQYAAIEAYSGDETVNEYIAACSRIHKAVSEYMFQRFEKMNVECVKPMGAFYLFPNFNNYRSNFKKLEITNSTQMANYFLDHLKVAVLPGCDFYCLDDLLACRVATVDYDGDTVYLKSLEIGKLDSGFVEEMCPNIAIGCDILENFLQNLQE